ncbi:MAG: CPBP family glutamic-type intramembrane protease [Nitrospinota bacterium]|nr:CPBP family glutamic-type intramembrane protease [Nitrospinota bacterium]
MVLTGVLALKHVSFQQLGFNKNNIGKSLAIGILCGALPVMAVALLDGLLVKAGLSQSELLAGADLRTPEEMGFNLSSSGNIFATLIIPFIDQVFVVGLIVNNLLIKGNTGRVIISGGLLYPLFHFKPSIGNLFLGMISAGLLKVTGSIIAPILVHIGFAIAEILIVFNYPRLISILVFFV